MTTKTVLVIDDSIMIRKMVASILADQFQVVEAKDGLTGLEAAKKHHPDLILLDFVMPKMDGYDTLQAIRREDSLKNTPIIMMSGLKEQVTARIPEPFVDFDFIEKPFEADALLALIQKVLQVAPAAAPEPGSETNTQLILNRLTAIETLLIQGTENLIQREVVARLSGINQRLARQESRSSNLEAQISKLAGEVERHAQGLALIVKELRQIRKLLGGS
ncbi:MULTISPECIES: response regulator [unclassified Synechococcus]|jgi:DNA-binding response OmpR family regulator|uniref:response regulator n=1 Tax=unclassified Synechococcus TaxID=2626047 RepID=UPI0000695121|nr:response regulator [Synechococcus sp. JA-2-3B'a(2-13)]ABD03007.1 response regulator [Synechococcus sp. JA-2-3B'a(2-13)]